YHADKHHQPYSLIEYDPDWTITVSHELLEMRADPWGNRLRAGNLRGHRVRFLLEVADPCEAFSYTVNGVAVSDFITPHWYDPDGAAPARCSFMGMISAPRTIAKGGYVS